MKCPRCEHENRFAAKFCEECATPFALAEELGMRPLAAHCHLGLGKLYRRWLMQAETERTVLGPE